MLSNIDLSHAILKKLSLDLQKLQQRDIESLRNYVDKFNIEASKSIT